MGTLRGIKLPIGVCVQQEANNQIFALRVSKLSLNLRR
jgi:hypothetical protein